MALRVTAAAPEERTAPGPRGRLIRNLAVLASGQLITWALSFVWTVFVPRAIGPAAMGELTVATSVSTILGSVIGLGIGTLMVREIARDHGRAPALLGTALLTRLLLLAPALLAAAGYTVLARTSPELTAVIWLSTAAMLLGLFSGPFLAALQAVEQMQYQAYSDVLGKGVVAGVSIALVLVGFGLVPLMVLGLVIAALVTMLSWWWSRSHFPIEWRLRWSEVRFLTVGSLPFWSTGLILTFYMWIDSLMLSALTPIKVVGWYGVPTKLFATLLFLPVILGTVYFPRLSRAFRDGTRALAREARPAVELVMVLSLPVAMGTAVVAPALVWVLYGARYLPSVPVLMILAVCIPPTYLNIMANQVLVAANRQWDWTRIMIGAAIVNPLLNLALIHQAQEHWHNGALGAALALLATEVGMAGAAFAVMPPVLTWSSLFRVARAAAAAVVMGAVVWLLAHRFGLAVQVAAGTGSFAALALLFRLLTAAEAAELRSLASRAVGRLRPRAEAPGR